MRDVLDRRGRRDEREVELALQSLPRDLHVQQAEEPTAEAEAERGGRLGLEGDGGVGELEFFQRVTQLRQLVTVNRVEAAKDHGLGVPVARERCACRLGGVGHGLADLRLGHGFDTGDQVADLAWPELFHRLVTGRADADLLDLMGGARLEEADPRGGTKSAVNDPDRVDDPPVLVVEGVEDERSERVVGIADRSRDTGDYRVEKLWYALAGLGRDPEYVLCGEAEHLLDLPRVAVRVSRRQIDLVEGGDDLEIVLDGEVAIGEGLGLDALRRVDEQHHALASGERPAHLVAEVDVAGRVDQVEHVALPSDADVLSLDGDSPLPLDVHRVEVLLADVTGVDGSGHLEDAVRQRRFPVVDVADDGEVADLRDRDQCALSPGDAVVGSSRVLVGASMVPFDSAAPRSRAWRAVPVSGCAYASCYSLAHTRAGSRQ